MAGLYFFDATQQLIGCVEPDRLFSQEHVEELGGHISMSAECAYLPEIEAARYCGHRVGATFYLFKLDSVVKDKDRIRVKGIHVFFDDLKGAVVRDIRPRNATARVALERILQGTGWEVGTVSTSKIASGSYYHESALSAFSDFLERWDCEARFEVSFLEGRVSRKVVHVADRLSGDYGRQFYYGDAILEVVAETALDVYTAFIGMGRGVETEAGGFGRKLKFADVVWRKADGDPVDKPAGQDFVEIPEATALFGYPDGTPKVGIVDFPDVEDAGELLRLTYDFAVEEARPKVQMRAKALADPTIELGEVCTVVRNDMQIRYKTRVFRVERDLLQPSNVAFEFGDRVVLSASERLRAQSAESRQKEEMLYSKLDRILAEVAASYFNEDGYNYELKVGNAYGLPAGYYSFDRPIDRNPTKVIYMGAGKLLIANAKSPDGRWNWRTALTGDGIAADVVTGALGQFATVSAEQINVGESFARTPLGQKVVVQGELYSNVKITPQNGVQVLDQQGRERVQLGNLAPGKYGLKLQNAEGTRTVLDDEGILQSWQDGRCDNFDDAHPLRLHVYVPKETSRIYFAGLRLFVEYFRAFSKAVSGGGGTRTTSGSGGGTYRSDTTSWGGGAFRSATSSVDNYIVGSRGGHNHAIPPGTNIWDKQGNWVASFAQSGDHTHSVSVEIPDHNHSFSLDVRDHTHSIDIPPHTHEIEFGIYEDARTASSMTIWVNGTDRTQALTGNGYFSGTQSECNMTPYLSVGVWNTIEIRGRGRGRVDATVFIQALLRYS